ncbi:MAG TPA: hypothetical protein PKG98_09620, partial [Myxococcota bacterium]|nr:hypothetical protein [Myxococcota bacterium]
CINFSCDDSTEVTAQCNYGLTECTCAAADPCQWANDGEYCDTPACQELFPDLTVFDDTTTDCAQ